MQTQIEKNTDQLSEHILDVIELFLQENNSNQKKEFDNYTISVYNSKDNGEDIVEWDYELHNSETFPIDEEAVLDKVFSQISYE